VSFDVELRRLDLKKPHERRLVLLLKREDIDDAESLTTAEVDLVAPA
jgi:hypothetical protein